MLIVTPIEFERSALADAATRHGWRLERSGPGRAAMEAWARAAMPAPGELVVLAGLCAGLAPHAAVGSAGVVHTVIDPDARAWTSPVTTEQGATIRLATVDALLTTPAERARLAALTGATHADMEGSAFARVATQRRWRWAIVRGVSDGAADTLNARIAGWTDAQGRTAVWQVLGGLLRAPWSIPAILRLARRAAVAMCEVELLLEAMGADTAKLDAVTTHVGAPTTRDD